MPIRKLFSGTSFGGDGDTRLDQLLAKSSKNEKVHQRQGFMTDEKEEPFSLSLSPDSYANMTETYAKNKKPDFK